MKQLTSTLKRTQVAILAFLFAMALAFGSQLAAPQAAYAVGDGPSFNPNSLSYSSSNSATATIDVVTQSGTNLESSFRLNPDSPSDTYYVCASLETSNFSNASANKIVTPTLSLVASDLKDIDSKPFWTGSLGNSGTSKSIVRVEGKLTGNGFIKVATHQESSDDLTISNCTLTVKVYKIDKTTNCTADDVKFSGTFGFTANTKSATTIQANCSGYLKNTSRLPDSIDLVAVNTTTGESSTVAQVPYYFDVTDSTYPVHISGPVTWKGAKPNTSYRIKVIAHKAGCEDNVLASDFCTTPGFGNPSMRATKANANKAFLTVNLPNSDMTNGTTMKIYCGSTLIKTITSKSGITRYTYTYEKKGAGSASYKVVAEAAGGLKATSSTAKPVTNVRSTPNALHSITSYGKYNGYFVITKIAYKGTKKVKVTGYFINRHIYTCKLKVNFSLSVNGKKIASKTIKSKKLKTNTKKKITFTCKASAVADLANGAISINQKPYQY